MALKSGFADRYNVSTGFVTVSSPRVGIQPPNLEPVVERICIQNDTPFERPIFNTF